MDNKLEHVPEVVKHIADAGAGASIVTTWISALTPVVNFSIIVMASIWGYFRIQDLRLASKLKRIEIDKHEAESDERNT